MKMDIIKIVGVSMALWLPLSGNSALLGTRQRTVQPVALTNVPGILLSNLPMYEVYGYSSWQWGPGADSGQMTNILSAPAGYTATNAARLLTFFCVSDVHICDKESPSASYWAAYETQPGFTNNTPAPGGGNSSAYSPVVLYTPQVLDAAVRTANAVNRVMPFDFAFALGDNANNSQYNELRWFIDVMDGNTNIIPSSGAHLGAATIDYQMPFAAAGLDPSIPWYQVLGNHDHMWLGSLERTDYFWKSYTNSQVILFGDLPVDGINARNDFMGVVDGSTPYGNIIGVGPVTNFLGTNLLGEIVTNAPTVVADPNRHGLTASSWMNEFFTTTAQPVGHGFSQWNVTNNFACYSFQPKADLPLKVIVLDDTIPEELIDFAAGITGAVGYLDTNRLAWLEGELAAGQTNDQLMIIAAHVPIEAVGDGQSNTPAVSEAQLLATLHRYPNLILWVTGHLHQNTVWAQVSTNDPAYCNFWEVETPSLRDFPQEFRMFEILRNTDNSISIKTTDIDPEVTPGSCADKSRGFAIGAARICANPCTSPVSVGNNLWNFTDTNSFTLNAELIKFLTPHMQTVIANLGGPLGHRVAIDSTGTGATINFLGTLQSATNILGSWNDVTTNSPYAAAITNTMIFYRAVE